MAPGSAPARTSPLPLQALFARACAQDFGDTEGRQQRYREVPGKLREALADLRGREPALECVVHLGDIINGQFEAKASMADFNLIAGVFEAGLVRAHGP